jgi:hypothetical protein
MSIWKKLFGGTSDSPSAPMSSNPTSTKDALRVDPRSITHIILLVDHSEPIKDVPDIAQFIHQVYVHTNPAMAQVHAACKIGIPTYYVETARNDPATGKFDPDAKHVVGPHLDQLFVPREHSLFVRFLTLPINGRKQEATLEIVYRTTKRAVVISTTQMQPYVA